MVDVIDSFGQNAGKVWKTLSSHNHLTKKKILEITQLKYDEFYSAIGWLARENKIRKDKLTYRLGETNLTWKIGGDAGKVWKALDMWGEVDVASLSRLACIEENDVFSAVGWLAREGKIGGIATYKNRNRRKYWLK